MENLKFKVARNNMLLFVFKFAHYRRLIFVVFLETYQIYMCNGFMTNISYHYNHINFLFVNIE